MKEKLLLTLLTIIKYKNNIKCLLMKRNLCNLEGVMSDRLDYRWWDDHYCEYKQIKMQDDMCRIAASIGDLSLLKYLHQNEYEWDEMTPACAAEGGHLECLKYAHQNGCEWNGRIMECAAQNGYLECVKYALENGCKWHGVAVEMAAYGGHLECLKHALENGGKRNAYSLTDAAQRGYEESLIYAKKTGCAWDYLFLNAKPGGHAECIEYLGKYCVN